MNEVETSTVELFVIWYKSNKMRFLPSMFGYLAGHLIGAGIYPSLESFFPPLSSLSLSGRRKKYEQYNDASNPT